MAPERCWLHSATRYEEPRGLSRHVGGAEGEGITRKKWAMIVWVRAPPCKHKFLCKTVESSEKGPRGRGTVSAQRAELLGKQP